ENSELFFAASRPGMFSFVAPLMAARSGAISLSVAAARCRDAVVVHLPAKPGPVSGCTQFAAVPVVNSMACRHRLEPPALVGGRPEPSSQPKSAARPVL